MILNGPVSLGEASVTVTDPCGSSLQTVPGPMGSITLGPGTYRPVFVGNSSLGFLNGGTSNFVVQVFTAFGPLTEYSKAVSSQGAMEQTFQYVYVGANTELYVTALATTSCGTASVSGAVAFEKVE